MDVLIQVLHVVLYFVILVFPIAHVARGGKFWIAVVLFWMAVVSLSVCSMMIGALIARTRPDLFCLFEEGPGAGAWLIAGWLPGMILAGVGRGIRLALQRRSQRAHDRAPIGHDNANNA